VASLIFTFAITVGTSAFVCAVTRTLTFTFAFTFAEFRAAAAVYTRNKTDFAIITFISVFSAYRSRVADFAFAIGAARWVAIFAIFFFTLTNRWETVSTAALLTLYSDR